MNLVPIDHAVFSFFSRCGWFDVSSRRGNVPDKKRKEKHAHLLRVSINTRIVERLIFFDHSARRTLKKNLALETSNARD